MTSNVPFAAAARHAAVFALVCSAVLSAPHASAAVVTGAQPDAAATALKPPKPLIPPEANRLPPKPRGGVDVARLPPKPRGGVDFARLPPKPRGGVDLARLPPKPRGGIDFARLPPKPRGAPALA